MTSRILTLALDERKRIGHPQPVYPEVPTEQEARYIPQLVAGATVRTLEGLKHRLLSP
jgi:hypothetical protein